jgi:hypothetical protein
MVWDGVERRVTTPCTLSELKKHIDERIRLRLDEHAKTETDQLNTRFDKLEALLKSGFPGGDPEEHRRYHDEVIDFMRERRDLWKAIREKTIPALVWSGLLAVGSAIYHYIKTKLGAP